MLIDDMVAVVRACRSGVPLPVAAGSARVPWRRVLAWLDLAARGEEPFSSFAVEVEGARCDVQVRTMECLQRMAQVDPRAAQMVLRLADRDGAPGRRWPLPKARMEMARELELAQVERRDSDAYKLRDAAEQTPAVLARIRSV